MMTQTADTLFSEIESLRSMYEGLLAKSAVDQEMIARYKDEVDHLNEMLLDFKRHRFGTKSERWVSSEQLLFNEAEMLAQNPRTPEDEESEVNDQTVKVEAHTKRRGKRKPLPEDLEREIVTIELPESERIGDDGRVLKPIGKEISEKLFFEPAQLKVVEYHRIRYGADSGDKGVIAPPVPSIIPKGIPEANLLAHVVMQKYGYGLPFYRMEDMFKRMGAEIPRCTLARWIIQCYEACLAIKNVLNDRLMASPYVRCDETWTQVLKEKGRTAQSTSWMWVRATPSDLKKIVLFDYDPHRSADVARRLFEDYKGTFQADGFASYNDLEKQKDIERRLGCNMHGRRKFESAFKVGAKNGKGLGEVALGYYKRLYKIEEDLRGLPWDERKRVRDEKSKPIWDEFKTWAIANEKKVPPKSKIGQAFHYFFGEYDHLIGYLENGMFEMDNGFAERAIKNFAIGRKNWMFSDTEAGAEASSFFYSIVVTAKLNGNDPYKILKTIFEKIPLAKSESDIDSLVDLILTRPTAA